MKYLVTGIIAVLFGMISFSSLATGLGYKMQLASDGIWGIKHGHNWEWPICIKAKQTTVECSKDGRDVVVYLCGNNCPLFNAASLIWYADSNKMCWSNSHGIQECRNYKPN